MEVIPPRKTPNRAKRKKPPLLYAAMHETNVALCLASGFLSPRTEVSANRDHHLAAGRLILEEGAPSTRSFRGAKGDLSYGATIVVEIDSALVPGGVREEGAVLLPLLSVTRLVFPTADARDEFEARTAAYADMPENSIAKVVDRTFFSSMSGVDDSPIASDGGMPMVAVGSDGEQAIAKMSSLPRWIELDSCAGALVAALSTIESSGGYAPLLVALSGLGGDPEVLSSSESFAWELCKRADAAVDADAYQPLLIALATSIVAAEQSDGFSAAAILRSLSELFASPGNSAPEAAAQRFIKYAQDVVALRKELPDGAFTDVQGSAIPRGALLFLLNPNPDTLAAIRLRTPGLGQSVYFVAAVLVGLRGGLTRMPREMKSKNSLFLTVPAFLLATQHRSGSALEIERRWADDAAAVVETSWQGRLLASTTEPPSLGAKLCEGLLRNAGLATRVDQADGNILADVARGSLHGVLSLRSATLPTFPRLPVVAATLQLRGRVSKRLGASFAKSINDSTQESGIHCSLVESDKAWCVHLCVHLAESAIPADFGKCLDVLWHHAEEAPRENSGEESLATGLLTGASA